jgi:hypothetical protein
VRSTAGLGFTTRSVVVFKGGGLTYYIVLSHHWFVLIDSGLNPIKSKNKGRPSYAIDFS